MMSVPPPAGKGTTRRMGLAGQAWAQAGARASVARRVGCMGFVSWIRGIRGLGGTVDSRCTPYNHGSSSGPWCSMRNDATDEPAQASGGVIAVTRALLLMEAFAVGEP